MKKSGPTMRTVVLRRPCGKEQAGRIEMTVDIETRQTTQDTTSEAKTCREGNKAETLVEADIARPEFNRYLYDNLWSNLECQIEYWNRKAESHADTAAGQALRFKAEGLGYALRLLNAFEPEFRELVDCASRTAMDGTDQ
jgi:hypothetical protein